MRNHQTFAALLLLLWIAGIAVSGQAGLLDTRYDIRVTLDTDAHTLVGTQTVTITNHTNEPLRTVAFALIANWGAEENPYLHPALSDAQYVAGFDPTWTRITRVKSEDGQDLSYRLEDAQPLLQTYSLANGFLVVELDNPVEFDASLSFTIGFETKFAHAMAADNCLYKDTYVWRFGWNPVAVDEGAREGKFELPAADYHVELTIPEAYAAYCGADSLQEIASTSGLRTIELSNDGPVRSVPLVIGPDLQAVSSDWNGVALQVVTLPGGESYARETLSYAEEILAYYTQHYGPFPAARLVIAQNPTPGFFGMAANGLVLVGSSMVTLKDMPALDVYTRIHEYLLAHEIAHLWWGIGIGADFNAENWISEGFAEYLSISYFEQKHGAFEPNLLAHLQPGLIEDLLIETFGYLNLRQHMSELPYLALLQMDFDEPIVQPLVESEYLNGLTIRTYNKGYLVLRALEALLGHATMEAVLVETQAAWDGDLLSVDAFLELAQRISGIDLQEFFDAWVTGDARFDVSIVGWDAVQTKDGYKNVLHCSGLDSIFPVVVEVTLINNSTFETTLAANCCPSGDTTLDTELPIRSITLDPNEMLPDGNRFNNHWPRKVIVDHPFGSQEETQAGMPLDAYVIDVSPFGVSGGFRNDHAWSLMALPYLNPNATDIQLEDLVSQWDIVGTFVANIRRDLAVNFTGAITALDLRSGDGEADLALSAIALGFSHPETGNAGQYWYPSWRSTLTIGALGELPQMIPYLSVSVLRDDRLAWTLWNEVTLELGIPGFGVQPFGTIAWDLSKRFRLGHLLYIDVSTTISETLSAQLPNAFLFEQDQLISFDYLPMGHHQMFGRAKLVLPPLVRDAGYAIFNLTRIDAITPSFFIQGGRTQANCTSVCEPGIRLEAGAALDFTCPFFLGAQVHLTLGYAHPLLGIDGEGRLFVDLDGGF